MWHVEKDPILRSTIVAVAVFDRPPDFERMRARIDRATCLIPRFRQRVQSPPFRLGPPRWSVEATFDLDFHLRRMRLPAPGSERTLLDALQPMAAGELRPRAPAVGVHAHRGLDRRRRHRARRVRDEGAPFGHRRRGRHGAARPPRRPHRRRRGAAGRARRARAGADGLAPASCASRSRTRTRRALGIDPPRSRRRRATRRSPRCASGRRGRGARAHRDARSAARSRRPRNRCRPSCATAGSAAASTSSISRSTTSAARPRPPKAA